MIPLPVNRAVSMFSQKITAYDTEGSYVNHEWIDATGDDYTFAGKIAPASDKELELFEQGDISSGVLMVHVLSGVTLHFKDTNQTSIEGTQTYIRHQGDVWRIKPISNRSNDGAHKRYGAVRYIERRAP